MRFPRGSTVRITLPHQAEMVYEKVGILDLFDLAMLNYSGKSRTFIMNLKINSIRWPYWNEAALSSIELEIKKDFAFDACATKIERFSSFKNTPCTEEFTWKIHVCSDF
ncbi:MAG: hypothetical protein KGM99_15730 [Burkholderiales bacterium]|nr:hypothetical protein [Burkholderiales bacterium]